MTNVFLLRRLVGLDLERRLEQDYCRPEDGPFKGDRCDIYIDFLDFTSQQVWMEDLSSSDQISTDNPRDGLTLPFIYPFNSFTFEASGLGPLSLLRRASHLSGIWQFCNDKQPPSQGVAEGANISV